MFNKAGLVLTIGLVALSQGAYSALSSGVIENDQTQMGQVIGYKSPFLLDQVHVSKKSGSIQVEAAVDDAGDEIQELKGQFIDVPAGSILTLIDQSEDGQVVTLSFDLEGMMAEGKDVSELPNLLKVRAFELSKLDLSMTEISYNEEGDGSIVIPEFLAARKKGGKAKMTYCLVDVRVFAASKACKAKIQRVPYARMGYAAYLATGGWQKISRKSWKDYPVCSACFYSGGRQDCKGGCGHTAIKINSNQWKGAGVRTRPGLPDRNGYYKGVLRRPYKFLGCLIPKHKAR